MIRLIFALLALMVSPVAAQTAKVLSGDHDGFSRLVVELPGPSDWQMGRTPDGYALTVATAPADYDLAAVFNLIRRNRLAAVSVDAATGNLQIGLACACHAIPFEFRPGVIVIDIRDGAPPEGSSFEQPLPAASAPIDPEAVADGEGTPAPLPDAKDDSSVPPPKPSRWVFSARGPATRTDNPAPKGETFVPQWPSLEAALGATKAPEPADEPAHKPAPPSGPMATLRGDLLLQISRGATRGVVDLAPADASEHSGDTKDPGMQAFAQVAVDPVPGVEAVTAGDPAAALTPDGTACIADDRLNISEWGRDGPVAAQMTILTTGIVGEFDAVNADALGMSVRYALHLGFGVEAGRLIQVFPASEIAIEAPVWTSMGRIIDGYPDPAGVFAGMQTCDTAAALWAALAAERLERGALVNTQATLRSFSALPLHLRLALGPTLATRFLDIGQEEVAQTIRDAIARAPEGPAHEADLIGAKLDLANGDTQGAADLAQSVIDEAGPGVAEAMLALVRATLAEGKAVDAGTTDALAAILNENEGAALQEQLTDALILALASGGSADAAFARLPDHPDSESALWEALAKSGSDDDILKHAIRPFDAAPADTSPDTRARISERLDGLGFPVEAALWREPGHAPATYETAKVAASLANAKNVVPALAEERALIAARDWDALARDGSAVWQSAARHLVTPPVDSPKMPPLAEATALLDATATMRGDVTALLSAVPPVDAVESAENP